LSDDGKTILAESNRNRGSIHEGFYTVQRGDGVRLVIADKTTLIEAKILAARQPNVTVVLSNQDHYAQLQEYLNAQGINPEKVLVLGHSSDRDKQMHVAELTKAFHTNGAVISLMDVSSKKVSMLDPVALEKTRLKMSFEKLIAQKPAPIDAEKLTPKELFNRLKKDYPALVDYERHARDFRETLTGVARERIERKLLELAKAISGDKKLAALLQRDVPKVALDIKKRLAREHDRGIGR